jgi:hypothetical protein
VKVEAFKRSINKADGNSIYTQVDLPVDLGPNKKKEVSFGYEMILAYISPFYIKKRRSQCQLSIALKSRNLLRLGKTW